jgi:intein/homing endonuclease
MDQKVGIRIDLKGGTEKDLRKDNLGNKAKDRKGRFMKIGVLVNRCNRDSYLVRNESGKPVRRRHYRSILITS